MVARVRPLPPLIGLVDFAEGDQIEVKMNDGWWFAQVASPPPLAPRPPERDAPCALTGSHRPSAVGRLEAICKARLEITR